jgi:hypothetical protein
MPPPTQVDVSDLRAELPPVNPDAVAFAAEPAAPVQPGPVTTAEPIREAVEVDGGGVPFDASKHLPKKHPRSGRWMPRRKPKGETGPVPTEETGSVVGTDEEPVAGPAGVPSGANSPTDGPDVFTVMADLHCRAFYGVSVAFLSDEWLASKEEHRTNVDTLAAYYRLTGMSPNSPGFALLAQGVAFAGKRLALPKTQTRLGMLRAWFGAKWAGWRGKRRAAAVAHVSN